MHYSTPVRLTPQTAKQLIEQHNNSNRPYLREAYRRGYEIDVFPGTAVFRARVAGVSWQYFYAAHVPLNSHIAGALANNKFLSNILMTDAGVPVPDGAQLTSEEYHADHMNLSDLPYPVVVKPVAYTSSGQGVQTNIPDEPSLRRLLDDFFTTYPTAQIEEYIADTNEYRILLLDQRVIAGIRKVPAYVIGDGQATIRQLIDERNAQRAAVTDVNLGPVQYTSDVERKLAEQQYALETILPANTRVQLTNIANAAQGSEFEDVTDDICAENVQIFGQAMQALGLRFTGIDVLAANLRTPLPDSGGKIIEINHFPGITCHVYPHRGKSRDVATPVLDAIFWN